MEEFAKIKDEVPSVIMDAHMTKVKEASERGEEDAIGKHFLMSTDFDINLFQMKGVSVSLP